MSVFDEIPDALRGGVYEITVTVARYQDDKPAAYRANVIPKHYGPTSHRGFAIFGTAEAALKHAMHRHRSGEGAAFPKNSTPTIDLPVEQEEDDDLDVDLDGLLDLDD